ncbi:hypothetical protein SKAU_G00318130 [Synaphobranchus kaupii]|uniref:Uncharacterized protein n=1 Tax=Synaphobranchus kaupii TaxID=118154 RepID=A0A9Q1IJU0_SYNKA|nr:hypothetical protein SKAU_G00318130 [Synaphobranchus kaupii]
MIRFWPSGHGSVSSSLPFVTQELAAHSDCCNPTDGEVDSIAYSWADPSVQTSPFDGFCLRQALRFLQLNTKNPRAPEAPDQARIAAASAPLPHSPTPE